MIKTSILKTGIVNTTLLNQPIVKTCQNGMSVGAITVSKDKTYYVEYIRKALGNGTPTVEKCSAIGYAMYKSDWSWTRSIGLTSDSTAYSQIGKLVKIKGSFTIPAANDGESANQMFYWLVRNAYANGTDNQTHELYYYKVWDSTGYVIAQYGTENCAININDWIEV